MRRVWKTAGAVFVVATGMALWALLREERPQLEERDNQVDRLRNLGAA